MIGTANYRYHLIFETARFFERTAKLKIECLLYSCVEDIINFIKDISDSGILNIVFWTKGKMQISGKCCLWN